MGSRRVLLVDVLTIEPLSDNAAGVVPGTDGLNAEQIRALAAKPGVSEMALICSPAVTDRYICYLTPQQEIDLCGRAVVTTHAYPTAEHGLEPGTHTLRTSIDTLDIELDDLGKV